MKQICIVCNQELGEISSDSRIVNTNGCTSWSSSGNYGSRIIDCAGRHDYGVDELMIFICDPCLDKTQSVLSLQLLKLLKLTFLGLLKTCGMKKKPMKSLIREIGS